MTPGGRAGCPGGCPANVSVSRRVVSSRVVSWRVVSRRVVSSRVSCEGFLSAILNVPDTTF